MLDSVIRPQQRNTPLSVTKTALTIAAICYASCAMGAEEPENTADTGKQIFDQVCFTCHGTGMHDAPVIGDGFAWDPRKEKGIPALLQNALNGLGYMPPRGSCTDCSDAEIEAAVKYLVRD